MIARIAMAAAAAAGLSAGPALAASGPFFSLRNTDFIVLLAFLVFVGILLYFRVPSAVAKLLDKRAETIKADIAEARRLRDEAQDIYAGYERRQREVKGQAAEIVANAKREYLDNQEHYDNQLWAGIERLAQWSRDTGKPLVTTECWAIVDYKDWPGLNWDWVNDLNARAVEKAARTGRWIGVGTSNFAAPQFLSLIHI